MQIIAHRVVPIVAGLAAWWMLATSAFGIHNSFGLRERLREANSDPVRLQRRDPHRGVMRDPKATPSAGDFEAKGPWRVEAYAPADAAALLRDDVTDFLRRMGVEVSQTAGTGRPISLGLNKDVPSRGFRLDLGPDAMHIEGGDMAGLWAGVAWWEREMRVRRGPFLPRGKVERQAPWSTQISQGPWGGNYSVPDFSPEYLSDDAFRLYAHYGVNSMMIYGDALCYVRSAVLPELNHPEYAKHIAMLDDASRRAARYGVRFTYVPIGAKLRPDHPVFRNHPEVRGTVFGGGGLQFLCSSSPTTLKFYEELFADVSRAGRLAGVVLITYSESWYHCRMWDSQTKTPCSRCAKLPVHDMVARSVDAIDRGVRHGSPDAFTAQWIYTWDRGDRREGFRPMAPHVGMFHHVEKDNSFRKQGYTKSVWDYSIDYTGPSPEIQQLAAFAHQTHRPLMVKTETGIGLEVIQFPYVPAMQHLATKWQGVRSLKPRGVHQAWLFFGMCGTRAEELGLWAAYDGERPAERFLRESAVRDFGPEAADRVLASWAAMSRAVTHLPAIQLPGYYMGPTFLGPCHPLVPSASDAVPDTFDAYLYYLQEGEETFSTKQIQQARTSLAMRDLPPTSAHVGVVPDDPRSDGWELVGREYAAAAQAAREALDALRAAGETARTKGDRMNFQEEADLTELAYRTFLACANTVEFHRARRAWEKGRDRANLQQMHEIARRERDNALAAGPIYARSRWLDPALRLDGRFRPAQEMIREKVAGLDRFLRQP